ncbi:MAG: beta-N-acetylhexosaminidase [Psychromonas sp.]|nr:beta-N-acetylhexosaminidase [Psychromonas sp.]
MFNNTLFVAFIITLLSACSTPRNPQIDVDNLANNLDISYTVLKNTGTPSGALKGDDCKALGAEWAACNSVDIALKNTGKAINSKNWVIYFHSIRRILHVANPQFKITHVTGDLHKLEPTKKFKGFAAGEQIIIPITGEYWQLFETDFYPGAFVTAPNAQPRAILSLHNINNASTYVTNIKGDLYKRTANDHNILATPNSRYKKNADTVQIDITKDIIPTPEKIKIRRAKVNLKGGIKIIAQGLSEAKIDAINQRAEFLELPTNGSYNINIKVDRKAFGRTGIKGQYKLNLASTNTKIVAFDQSGAFYAMQSFFSLVSLDSKILPSVLVEDAPRFKYRGIMIDVARNFHSKKSILALIDQMAAYKMNKLHLHLSDDEGWRLAIPGLPELTDVGAKRCFDKSEIKCLLPQLGSGFDSNNFGSGYYTRADFIEILTYAKARSVDVIPEFDMPAHARAAVVSMEARYNRLKKSGNTTAANEYRLMDPDDTSNVTTVQFYHKKSFINPCMDSSYHFATKVISEVAAMYKKAGVPFTTWHFGGDEAKNIALGAGFQDINDKEKVAFKGTIDQSKQDLPFAKSPLCKKLIDTGTVQTTQELPGYFAEKLSGIVAKQGIENLQGWEDGLKYAKNAKSFATKTVRANFWETLFWGGADSAYKWSEKGYKMIISSPDYVYMDFPYEVDPKERGYYWATRYNDTRKMFTFAPENLPQNAETSLDRDGNGFKSSGSVKGKPFFGLSAQLWSETVRTDAQMQYMVFPRVLAVAERAWHKANWELNYKVGVKYAQNTHLVNKEKLHKDWQIFANILGQRELAKLAKANIYYRLPVPGAIIKNGMLKMNSQFPGFALQYSVDEGKAWVDYTQAVKVEGEVLIRSKSTTDDRTSRITILREI